MDELHGICSIPSHVEILEIPRHCELWCWMYKPGKWKGAVRAGVS